MAEMEYNERYKAVENALDKSQRIMEEDGVDFKYMVTQSFGGKVFHGVFNIKVNEDKEG